MAKRKDFSFAEKFDLIKRFDALPKCNQREAANKLGLKQPTLCRLLKKRNEILENHDSLRNKNRKRHRVGKAEDVEAALLEWYSAVRNKNVALSRAILILKAEEFASQLGIENFKATDGWLTRWKERNAISKKKELGEMLDADFAFTGNWKTDVLPGLLCKYSLDKIYVIVETALCYRALPDHTLIFKNRITILLACNSTGTVKKQPFVVGKLKNPRSLKGVKRFPVLYANNANAWMTSELFKKYMTRWDNELKEEKIAVLLNNSTAHPPIDLKNIKLFYLPSDTMSSELPLVKGIIKTFKTLYRRDLKMKIIESVDDLSQATATNIAKSISLLDAFHMLVNAWKNVCEKTILNCFKRIGVKKTEANNLRNETDMSREPLIDPDSITPQLDLLCGEELGEGFWAWVEIDAEQQTSAESPEEDIALPIDQSSEIPIEERDEEDECDPPPTAEESRTALQILRRTLEQRGGTIEDYDAFYEIQTRVSNLISQTRTQLL